MSHCELTKRCVFFEKRMTNMPSMAHMYQKKYCEGDYGECARYQVFEALDFDSVPADLYPNDLARAQTVIGA